MQVGEGFGGSLVKVISVNFFCLMNKQKKVLLGLRQFSCNPLGETGWQTAVQMQGLWHSVYPQQP